ncbi:MAG TPA: hypothetical protein VFO81_10215, partial [Gaiellaceae bacterium]|nr:hypothetical protein [Gaiellaceae bacterium]
PEPLLQLGDDCPAFAPAGIVVELARSGNEVPDEHELLAPSPIRSQTLLNRHEAVHRGELESEAAQELLERSWKLPIRLLDNTASGALAWKLAEELGWASTCAAEYVELRGCRRTST